MLEKIRQFFEIKREQHKQKYDVTLDNVAIPEIHTNKTPEHDTDTTEDAPISYDNVAIPEVHIRSKKKQ